MDWKVRKDKRKAEPEPETATESPASNVEDSAQTEDPMPVFDLSGDSFRSASETTENQAEPIALGSESAAADAEPIALEPLDVEPSEPDSVSRFDIDSTPRETEVIATPPPAEQNSQDIDEPRFDISPERESIAPGLVTTQSDTGLPKVAPFIVDVEPDQQPREEANTHSIVMRIGKLSAAHPLTKDITTIGRPDSVVQNYPDLEIELDDGVSRRHAEVRRHGDQYVLADVGSTNGTILNGERLTPNEESPLTSGDRIHIGERTELTFE